MKKFISTRLAFMATHYKAKLVLSQEGSSDVRAEVGASTSKSIGHATARALRVGPQDVEYLDVIIIFVHLCISKTHLQHYRDCKMTTIFFK